MRFAYFCHSLLSDWNHGNAHFLRGIAAELIDRGHDVRVYEPRGGWSLSNLMSEHGEQAVLGFRKAYPQLNTTFYDLPFVPDAMLDGADVVIVHEWNDPQVVAQIGRACAGQRGVRLFFHDTHHRAVTQPEVMSQFDLSHYHGVLAFGTVIRDRYLEQGWAQRAWAWHEAADLRVFRPLRPQEPAGDLIWIGNWGDGERSEELQTYLLDPVRRLRLRAQAYGVRYPDEGRRALAEAGIDYGGWLPNFRVPQVYSRFRATVHIPRRPYRERIPGVPTIRVFEALACGIPLISLHWDDSEGLFSPGSDYLDIRTGRQMVAALRSVLADDDLASSLAAHGRSTIEQRHTCRHRVDELMEILSELAPVKRPPRPLASLSSH